MTIVHARGARAGAVITSLVIAAGALGGCAESPNDVASVNGTTISRDQLDQATSAAAEALGSDSIDQTQVATLLIQGTVADQLASQRRLTITDSDRDAIRIQLAAGQPTTIGNLTRSHPAAEPLLYKFADLQIVLASAGQQEVASVITKSQVTLNPRYGRWDPTRSVSVIADDGSLSQVLQQDTP